MPVTLDAKGRARLKQGRRVKPKRTVKRRSAAAASLSDPRYRKRVVKSGKAYRRKGKAPGQAEEDE